VAVDRLLAGHGREGRVPELWDGRAAERIVNVLLHVPPQTEQPGNREAHAAVA
jgi:UDP-N-acetylglucosamine 2-epimerase (non-hydrolysing)